MAELTFSGRHGFQRGGKVYKWRVWGQLPGVLGRRIWMALLTDAGACYRPYWTWRDLLTKAGLPAGDAVKLAIKELQRLADLRADSDGALIVGGLPYSSTDLRLIERLDLETHTLTLPRWMDVGYCLEIDHDTWKAHVMRLIRSLPDCMNYASKSFGGKTEWT